MICNASRELHLESSSLLHSMVFTGYLMKTDCGVYSRKTLLNIAMFQNMSFYPY